MQSSKMYRKRMNPIKKRTSPVWSARLDNVLLGQRTQIELSFKQRKRNHIESILISWCGRILFCDRFGPEGKPENISILLLSERERKLDT